MPSAPRVASIAVACRIQILLAPAPPPKPEIDQRVEPLIAKMTLEDKLTLIGGANDLFPHPIPRLGIPSFKMSDGPLGVHANRSKSVARFLANVKPGSPRAFIAATLPHRGGYRGCTPKDGLRGAHVVITVIDTHNDDMFRI